MNEIVASTTKTVQYFFAVPARPLDATPAPPWNLLILRQFLVSTRGAA